jgi:hypothetical protein
VTTADGEGAEVPSDLGDDGSRAGARAAAHSRGHEDHVRSPKSLGDRLPVLERGLLADFGLAAGAEAVGDLRAEREPRLGSRKAQRLHVGVRDDELNVLESRRDHPIDGVRAAAARSYHLYDRRTDPVSSITSMFIFPSRSFALA